MENKCNTCIHRKVCANKEKYNAMDEFLKSIVSGAEYDQVKKKVILPPEIAKGALIKKVYKNQTTVLKDPTLTEAGLEIELHCSNYNCSYCEEEDEN